MGSEVFSTSPPRHKPTHERTDRKPVGTMGGGENTAWAEGLFVNLVADIAVLASPTADLYKSTNYAAMESLSKTAVKLAADFIA